MKFVLKKRYTDGHGVWYWFIVVAANGEPVMASEMYTRREGALDTIAAIKAGIGADTPIDDETRDS